MSRVSGRVLIVDDDQSTCELLDAGLRRRGFETRWHTSANEAFAALASEDFDVVLTDLNMRGMSGIELCTRIVANRPDVPVIVVTAFGSLETAVSAIRAGAYDFITKPFEIDAIELTLQRALQQRALREEVKRLRSVLDESRRLDDLLGASAAMREVFELTERVAAAAVTVLITGETGTGKEMVARAIHRRSRCHDGPFVSVNCAAMPEALLESELFGHVRGAFTDARTSRRGLFLQASGGTLFLDEIGDLPLSLQPKLLRALQEHTIRPLGSDEEIACDARIVVATNRDLDAAVEEGRFRADLYFRVNVLHLHLPPLRARGSDVLLLAQHFLERGAARADKRALSLSPAAAEKLLAYAWPGNVRELENCIERAVALSRYEQIVVEDLPERIRTYATTDVIVAGTDPSELVSMEEVERRYILRVLDAVGGNKTLAAQVLGFDRKTLYRKLERYGRAGADPQVDAKPPMA
jgi:two-component system response regulator AtoC